MRLEQSIFHAEDSTRWRLGGGKCFNNRGSGETVLVVDDDPTVRMLVTEVLAENSYHIMEATDGPSATKLMESDRRIDLLIDRKSVV